MCVWKFENCESTLLSVVVVPTYVSPVLLPLHYNRLEQVPNSGKAGCAAGTQSSGCRHTLSSCAPPFPHPGSLDVATGGRGDVFLKQKTLDYLFISDSYPEH